MSGYAAEPVPDDTATVTFEYLLGIGFMAGGDTIATYEVTYPPGSLLGGETVDLDVKGGNGGYYFIGAGAHLPRYNLGTEIHWGLFKDGVGDAGRFSRLASEFILYAELNRWRIGGGVMHHGSPEFKDDQLGNLEFKDAVGWLGQLEYRFEAGTLGVRYGDIDYELDTLTVNGDHWGLFGVLRFGQ
ncbi:MAG: hypothetical protein QNI96_14635 [Woeseiaceae bacterium]|nr:hypothetical protein [Woeseiaceae bacterium]